MANLAQRWRDLEDRLTTRGLGWALHHAPADLRHARSVEHPRGGRLDHLLPPDYRAFVADVGYPVLGFGYYDQAGLSFLPSEPMTGVSVDLPGPEDEWPTPVDGEPTTCTFAFFAGTELAEIEGYAFGPADGAGEPVVWLVEGGMAREVIGPFDPWLRAEITRLETLVDALDDADVARLVESNDGEDDPHRLLDYSLGGTYDQAPYSPADLDLSWVESQSRTPYEYGLINGAGDWLIPLGRRFRSVRPFRDGTAEVILNTPDTSYSGPWTRIQPDGSPT